MANKIRVYELAKEAGMKSKVLTTQLMELGYDVKAYNSTLDENTAEEIRERLGLKNISVERKRIEKAGRTVIRRRRKQKTPAEIEAEAPAEERRDILHEPEAADGEEVIRDTEPEEAADFEPSAHEEVPVTPDEKAAEAAITAVEVEPERTAVGEEEVPESEEGITPAETEPEPLKDRDEQKISAPAEKPKVKGRQQVARFVGMTDIPVAKPAEDKIKHRKPAKPGKPAVADKVQVPAEEAAGGKKKPAKKGKRFVTFEHDEEETLRTRKKASVKGRAAPKVEEEILVEGDSYLSRDAKRGRRKKRKKEQPQAEGFAPAETKAIKKRIKVLESITVSELAHRMGIKANELIAKLMGLGVMATLNQPLDVDTASLVASDFGYEVERSETDEQSLLHLEEEESAGVGLPRPPVVTVMGHVDHGKTSILDAIRKTDVASGEAGGITQHIGAHYVRSPQGDLVFLDTPGHAAFTEMRSRGAQITDVVVLVVAADDGVMDQTKEAINHAKAAEVPILVAVNKIDKDNADPDRVKRELAELELLPEDWGGETIYCETSAKQGIGIDDLVDNILLQTEILDLKANPDRRARGWVVEAQIHKGRGPVATVLVKQGTLRVGDSFVVGQYHGKVRSLSDDKGSKVEEAGPSRPVEVLGLSGVPQAGDEFIVLADEKMTKSVSEQRQHKARESELASATKISLDNLFEKLQEGEMKELRVVLRADVQGTLEAFSKAIEDLATDEIKVKIIHAGTGSIVESDILLASASDALVIGFNVRPAAKVKSLAEIEKVDVRYYDVIYHALEDIKNAMLGMLESTFEEKVIGTVEVRDTFHVPKVGTIAGCYVKEGMVDRNAKVRLLRDGVVVHTGEIASLKRFKNDAKEVQAGYECGIGIEKYNDIKIGDQLEVFVLEEKEPEL